MTTTRQVAACDPPNAEIATRARERHRELTKPAGSLGRLEELGIWAASVQGHCPPTPFSSARLVVFAGDHGVSRTAGTSAYPAEVTAQMVRTILAGGAAASVLARAHHVAVQVMDVAVDADPSYAADLGSNVTAQRIRRGSGSIDREDALTAEQAQSAFDVGVAAADSAVDSGCDLLIAGDLGIGNTTAAAAIIGLLTRNDASLVTGRGTGIDDATWMRKCTAVREAMRRARPARFEPMRVLAIAGGADLAAIAGFLVQAARRRTPVILDGTVITAAACIADILDQGAKAWWLAGHRSTEPAHDLALTRLDLTPVVDFQMRLGEGTGALIAFGVVQDSIAVLEQMSTFAEAGVSQADASTT